MTAPAPDPRDPSRLRNVALVGPSGAGKTTLVEALLLAAGAVPRLGDVQDGTTTCDSDEVERALGRSVALAVAPLEHRGTKVNLLDTPGSPGLVGALRAGLRAADGVLFVVSAVGGLDPVTAQLWAECEAAGTPRAVAVTQLDRARADFDEAVALCQRLLSEDVLPLALPMHDDGGAVAGLIALLDQRVVDHSSGARAERAADPEHLTLVADLRGDLVEEVLAHSDDGALLDAYLDGDEPEPAVVVAELHAALGRGDLQPAVPVAPLPGVGTRELLDLLVDGFPSPLQHASPPVTHADGSPAAPVTADPQGPLLAEVVARSGAVAYARVHSGTLTPGLVVHVAGRRTGTTRVGALSSPLGAALRPVDACPAGDLCAVEGLDVATGDVLSAPEDPLLLAPWRLPEPQHPVALETDDVDAVLAALGTLALEDPTVRVERGDQLVLWCVGEDHADVLLRRLGGAVRVVPVQVPRRQAGTVVLEPWSQVEVHVPTAFARTVASDLRGRRARATSTQVDEEDEDLSVVAAQLPDVELVGYATALRAVAYGTGTFTRRRLGWEPAQG